MITKAMIKSFLVNLSLTFVKLLGSFFSHSKTLMADAIHCLSDMSTDIIGLIGSKLAEKKPDKSHPFGHGRIEYLTSIIMSFFIIFLGLGVLYNSITSKNKIPNTYGLIFIIISIIIKLILSSYLLKKGKELNSNILTTNGKESRYDSYSSILALFFMLLSLLGNKYKIFIYADTLGSIIMSILTFKIGLEVLFSNVKSILGEIETDENLLKNIKDTIRKRHNNIEKIRRLTLIKYGSYYSATIDLIMNGSLLLDEIYKTEKKIKEELKTSKMNIRYVTVNIKPKKGHVTSK